MSEKDRPALPVRAAATGRGNVLAGQQDSVHRNEPETNSQAVADLLASLRQTRADLIVTISRLHGTGEQPDHGLCLLLGRIHLTVLAVQAVADD